MLIRISYQIAQFFILVRFDFTSAPFFRFRELAKSDLKLAPKAQAGFPFSVIPAGRVLQKDRQVRINTLRQGVAHRLCATSSATDSERDRAGSRSIWSFQPKC